MQLGPEFREALTTGAVTLGIAIPAGAAEKLERYASKLLQWNKKLNLTAITAPREIAEKHILDSLTLLKHLGDAKSVLDIGSGAGLPGVALACVRPDLKVTCCDSVTKKVTFIKAVAADLDLPVVGIACRAAGNPEAEGLPMSDLVVSRALADPVEWVPLAVQYANISGRIVGMLGQERDDTSLNEIAASNGLQLTRMERFQLPFSQAHRGIAVWTRAS